MKVQSVLVLLVLLIFVVVASVPFMAAEAAMPKDCRALYVVQPADTWNKIATKYQVNVNDLVKALKSKAWKDAPGKSDRRNLYVGDTLCIPKNLGDFIKKMPTWGDWPAANYTASYSARTGELTISTTWFNYPSTYFVKLGNTKLSRPLMVRYHRMSQVWKVSGKVPAMVCIKSLTTNANVCRPILKS